MLRLKRLSKILGSALIKIQRSEFITWSVGAKVACKRRRNQQYGKCEQR